MGNTLPKRTLWRRDKIGFFTPEANWLNEIKNPALEYFDERMRDVVDIKRLPSKWDSMFKAANRGSTDRLWRLINLAVWRHLHQV